MKTDDDALWILVKWRDIGQELFKNSILGHLSPRWLTMLTKDGKLSPKRLLSVGLTNNPNIKCDHVSKAEKVDGQTTLPNDDAENFEVDTRVNCQDSSQMDAHPASEEQSGEEITNSMVENIIILPPKVVLYTVSQTEDLKQ
jgi:hypothetical protein